MFGSLAIVTNNTTTVFQTLSLPTGPALESILDRLLSVDAPSPHKSETGSQRLMQPIDIGVANADPSRIIYIVPSPALIVAGPQEDRETRIATWRSWLSSLLQSGSDSIFLLNDVLRHFECFAEALGSSEKHVENIQPDLTQLTLEVRLLESIAATDPECVTLLAADFDDIKMYCQLLKDDLESVNSADRQWQESSSQALIAELTHCSASAQAQIRLSLQEAMSKAEDVSNRLDTALNHSASQISALQKQIAEGDDNLRTCELETAQLRERLVNSDQEIEILQLQAAQLQEELETTFGSHQDAENVWRKKEDDLNSSVADLKGSIQAFEDHCRELQEEIDNTTQERNAALERIEQLTAISDKVSAIETALSEEKATNGRLTTSVEITELQIMQLQEELELIEGDYSRTSDALHELTHNWLTGYQSGAATPPYSAFTLSEWFEAGNYEELKFHWRGVILDGDPVDISGKLVRRNFRPYFELRPEGSESLNLNWSDPAEDDFGVYLLFEPTALDAPPLLGALIQVCFAMLSSDIGLSGFDHEALPSVKRLIYDLYFSANSALRPNLNSSDHWLLNEYFEIEDYQHLAGSIDTTTNGRSSTLQLKLCANGKDLSEDPQERQLSLEIRSAAGARHTLPGWPYRIEDEWGPLLRVALKFEGPLVVATAPVELEEPARNFLEELIFNLPELLAEARVNEGDEVVKQALPIWNRVILDSFQDITCVSVSGTEPSPAVSLRRHETLAQRGYSHLAYVIQSDLGSHMIKMQAIDHFKDDTPGEPAIEVRAIAGSKLPLGASIFAGADEFGDLVNIRLSVLATLSEELTVIDGGPELEADDLALVINWMQLLKNVIAEGPEVDGDQFPAPAFWLDGLDALLSRLTH